MRVRVVEAGENRATAELDAPRGTSSEASDLLARSDGHDSISSNRHRFCPWAERIRREDLPTKENQICQRLALVLGESSGCEEGKECQSPGKLKHVRTVQVGRNVAPTDYTGQTNLEVGRRSSTTSGGGGHLPSNVLLERKVEHTVRHPVEDGEIAEVEEADLQFHESWQMPVQPEGSRKAIPCFTARRARIRKVRGGGHEPTPARGSRRRFRFA